MENFSQIKKIEELVQWWSDDSMEKEEKPHRLMTVTELFESLQDEYNNVYYGQRGNGYFIGHSNTQYRDFIYGEDDDGNDIVISYITDEYPHVGKVLVEADET